MFTILIASVVILADSGYGLVMVSKSTSSIGAEIAADTGAICLFVLSGLVAAYIAFVAYNYHAASYKAGIINREYKTNYTKEEIFYASDVIEKIREINRSRVELQIKQKSGE